MTTFNFLAGIASILGLFLSAAAAFQAKRASTAAQQARDAVASGTLAADLEEACVRAEHLVDLLAHGRYGEATLRVTDLVSSLSELPFHRARLLPTEVKNALLTGRQQLHSITASLDQAGSAAPPDGPQLLRVARAVSVALRESLGTIKSQVELGGKE